MKNVNGNWKMNMSKYQLISSIMLSNLKLTKMYKISSEIFYEIALQEIGRIANSNET